MNRFRGRWVICENAQLISSQSQLNRAAGQVHLTLTWFKLDYVSCLPERITSRALLTLFFSHFFPTDFVFCFVPGSSMPSNVFLIGQTIKNFVLWSDNLSVSVDLLFIGWKTKDNLLSLLSIFPFGSLNQLRISYPLGNNTKALWYVD